MPLQLNYYVMPLNSALMETALNLYESQLSTIADRCVDPWFAEELAKYRAGDEQAGRRISGSCLRAVLEIAKRRWHPNCALDILDLVQEGNVAIIDTLNDFPGGTANEFMAELARRVDHRLTLALADGN